MGGDKKKPTKSSAWGGSKETKPNRHLEKLEERKWLHDFAPRVSTGSWDIYTSQILLQQCNEEMPVTGERKSKRKWEMGKREKS